MRIGFSGAQGVGKTTLVNEMKKLDRFCEYTFYTNVVQNLLRDNPILSINTYGNYKSQKEIAKEILFNSFTENMITDRTMLDVMAYNLYLKNKLYNDRLDKEFVLSNVEYFEFLRIYKTYNDVDINFYMIPEFDLVDNGVRSMDKSYQFNIVKAFQEIICTHKKPVVYLTGTVENRMNTIMKEIDSYYLNKTRNPSSE